MLLLSRDESDIFTLGCAFVFFPSPSCLYFPAQSQSAYELMTTWEENCLDHLKEDEIKKFRPSIANFDCMRDGDDIEKAAKSAEAKYKAVLKIRKQKEEKEKEKNMKVGPDDEQHCSWIVCVCVCISCSGCVLPMFS